MLHATHTIGGRALRPGEDDPAPLLANVDLPSTTDIWSSPRRVRFRGWVTSPRRRECRVIALVGAFEARPIPLDQPRDDLDAALGSSAGEPGSSRGFDVELELPDDDVIVSLRFTDGEFVAFSDDYHIARGPRPRPREVSLPSDRRRERAADPHMRSQYREVWDHAAGEERIAKIAVAGYEDEAELARRAAETIDALQRTVGIGPGDEVLEIGAGVGRVGKVLAPQCKRWVGVDVSTKMLEHAARRLDGIENIELVAVNGWDLGPIPSESVDVVYSTIVFMHLDEWDRFAYVCEAMRVLRPGGRIYIDNYSLLSDLGWEFFLHHLEDFHPLDRPPNISKSSTPDELRTYLTRAGFGDVRVRSSGYFCWAWGTKGSSPEA